MNACSNSLPWYRMSLYYIQAYALQKSVCMNVVNGQYDTRNDGIQSHTARISKGLGGEVRRRFFARRLHVCRCAVCCRPKLACVYAGTTCTMAQTLSAAGAAITGACLRSVYRKPERTERG